MDNGFVKVSLIAPKVRVADCVFNADQTIASIKAAAQKGVRLALLPELGITGYSVGDLVLQPLLQHAALSQTLRVARETASLDIISFVGLPLAVGGKLYNACAVLSHGEIIGFVAKVHLPTYREFTEKRWYATAPDHIISVPVEGKSVPLGGRLVFKCIEQPDFTVAAEICEDAWVSRSPSAEHSGAANIVVNLSASNDVVCKADYRLQMVNVLSAKNTGAYLYCSCGEGESTTDCVFGGHRIAAELGKILAASELFDTDDLVTDIDVARISAERRCMISAGSPHPLPEYMEIPFSCKPNAQPLNRSFEPLVFVPSDKSELDRRVRSVFAMQTNALKTRLEHIGCKKALIGVSGGLDSTLALLVTVSAFDALGLDRKGIVAVTMPCFATTARTRSNAENLSVKLGTDFRAIDITTAVNQHLKDMGVESDDRGTHYENAQARERTQLLMDIANAENGIVIGTGDLSEAALGWCTYNGDHISMYNVNCTVPKTLIAHIIRYAASVYGGIEREVEDVIKTPISPELLKNGEGITQLTEEIIGPYMLHDFFLYHTLRWYYTPKRLMMIASLAFEGIYTQKEIAKWLRVFYTRFFRNQFKRSCVPDGPKIGSVSLSPRGDLHMPSDASAALWLAEMDKIDSQLSD